MARTEIREINGQNVGYNLDTHSYYPIGDSRYDPNYTAVITAADDEEPIERKRRPGRPRGSDSI